MTSESRLARWRRLKAAGEPTQAPPETPPALETVELAEIAGWLRRNVPEAWKQAALRRLWREDAQIRGFVGLADYAGDWNTPGGVPGFGPLGALDDLADLLARAMGTPATATPAPAIEAAPEPAPPPAIAPQPDPPPPARQIATAPRRGGRATPV